MNILKELYASDGKISSKRVFGSITLIAAIVMVYTGVDVEVVKAFLVTGTSLLGISIASEIGKITSVKSKE